MSHSLDSEPQEPMVGLWKNLWPYHDITVPKAYHKQRIGMKYKLVSGITSWWWLLY